MYESFYGLTSKPFQLNPDPAFFFGSKQHRRAKAYLEYGVSRNEGFIVITGEIGAGKTTVLRSLIEGLHGSNVVAGHLVTTQLGAEDTLRMVGAAFGFRVKDVPKSELLITLEAFLISQTSKGKRCLLIVDEAQNLNPKAVEELRMLSNFQFGNQALLQSFLIGQPEFREILQQPEMEQFRQRVAATCHIGPLDPEETEQYIRHRLKCAGASDKPVFDEGVFEAIHRASGGIPRRINSVCDRLMLLGFLAGKTEFTPADIDEVVREIAQENEVPLRSVRAAPPAPASAAAADGAGAALAVDVDLGQLLEPAEAEAMSKQIDALAADQRSDQLQRLERSLLRLERINLQTLSALKKLVNASKRQAAAEPAVAATSATTSATTPASAAASAAAPLPLAATHTTEGPASISGTEGD
jgi:general secretion pathway protein A